MFLEIINALRNNADDDAASVKGFYATHELSPESFHIEVEGVGKINFPIDQMTIQKLQDIYRISINLSVEFEKNL